MTLYPPLSHAYLLTAHKPRPIAGAVNRSQSTTPYTNVWVGRIWARRLAERNPKTPISSGWGWATPHIRSFVVGCRK